MSLAPAGAKNGIFDNFRGPIVTFGLTFAANITALEWAALSTTYQMEYQVNQDGTYSLAPSSYQDVALVDANGNPTGAISKAQGALALQLVTSWEIKSDQLIIYEMD